MPEYESLPTVIPGEPTRASWGNLVDADLDVLAARIIDLEAVVGSGGGHVAKHARVRAATIANITIATALNDLDVLDGVTLATGDLVLVKDQTAPAQNGIYVVGVTPARETTFDAYDDYPGAFITVLEGTANADTLWLCTSDAGGTLDTTAIDFSALPTSAITQLTGDVTAGPGSGSQAATIANDAVTNAKAANMAQSTIKGRAAGAGTGDPTDLTATQATAILNVVVGDSGSGGIKGLAPAPAAGDAAAGKFLKADGTFAVPSGTGVVGPVSSTDNAAARWNGTGGGTLQDSPQIFQDDGRISSVTDPSGLQDAATKAYVDGQIAQVTTGGGGAAQSTFRVSGGEVAWESAYTFRVSAATYYINGVLYTSAEQTITLDAADATLDRIDVIAVDDTGTVVKITGTAAAQPSEPDTDPSTQLKLAIVTVAAASSAPTTTSTTLYAEDLGSGSGEWNWATSGSGFNVASTNNPRTGTKDIEGTTVANGAYAQGQKGSGTIDPSTLDRLVLYIRSKATWGNNRVLRVSLLNAGVVKGTPLTIASGYWGFDSSITGSYQLISIPMSQFAVPAGTLINQLRIADSGGSIGFYLDDIAFQAGGFSGTTASGITQEQADARYAQRANNLSDVASASSARSNLSAAPKTPSFVTLGTDSELTSERVLTAGAGISLTDGGAGSIITVASTITAAITQLTGDVTAGPGSGSQAATIANDAVTNAKQANMAQSTIKGRAAGAGTGDPTDLTATQATAILDAMVGDSGSGGTKGLVPPPAAGDAAAGKFLKADGTYAAPSGTGAPTTAQYVTLATDATLTSERVLTGTANQVTVTDGGAGAAVTLSTPQDLHTGATPQFARQGLGVAADASAKLKIAGQYGSTLYDAGTSGTSKTIDWDNGNTQLLSMTGACTFTLSNPKDGFRYLLILVQDGTGSRVPTFPSSVKWAGGVTPTWSTAAGHADVVTLVWVAGIGASGNYVAAANTDYTPA